jgi:hypothetical protein
MASRSIKHIMQKICTLRMLPLVSMYICNTAEMRFKDLWCVNMLGKIDFTIKRELLVIYSPSSLFSL